MGRHAEHDMHENSLAAYAALDLNGREREVFAVYAASSVPLSDRDVLERLKQTDPNYVRPAITRMIDSGKLAELPKQFSVKCPTTGRRVRLVTIVARQLRIA